MRYPTYGIMHGEMLAAQTIILDPKTSNKVDKEMAGAVKRSRGVVKGSAVQIQRHTTCIT